MSFEETEPNAENQKPNPLDQLRDPNRFRMAVMGLVLLAGYGFVYLPLSERIQETAKKIDVAKKTLNVVRSTEQLQKQYRLVEDRLPKQTDAKEWAGYLLEGIRKFHLGVAKLNCDPPRQIGPCYAVAIRIDLEGTFAELDKLLRWLETDKRLFRVDSMRIAPAKSGGLELSVQMTILGLMG